MLSRPGFGKEHLSLAMEATGKLEIEGRWHAHFQVAQWLRSYERSWLRGDILAAITLAAYLLPAALGDASLANLKPETGLYACLFAMKAYGQGND